MGSLTRVRGMNAARVGEPCMVLAHQAYLPASLYAAWRSRIHSQGVRIHI